MAVIVTQKDQDLSTVKVLIFRLLHFNSIVKLLIGPPMSCIHVNKKSSVVVIYVVIIIFIS